MPYLPNTYIPYKSPNLVKALTGTCAFLDGQLKNSRSTNL